MACPKHCPCTTHCSARPTPTTLHIQLHLRAHLKAPEAQQLGDQLRTKNHTPQSCSVPPLMCVFPPHSQALIPLPQDLFPSPPAVWFILLDNPIISSLSLTPCLITLLGKFLCVHPSYPATRGLPGLNPLSCACFLLEVQSLALHSRDGIPFSPLPPNLPKHMGAAPQIS